MPSVNDIVASDMARLMADGNSLANYAVGYSPVGGTAFNGRGVWVAGAFLDMSPDERGRIEKADGKLMMDKAQFSSLDLTPKEGDSARVNGKTYSVISIEDDGLSLYTLTLSVSVFSSRSDDTIRRGGR